MNLIDCVIEEIITVEYMYHEKLGKKYVLDLNIVIWVVVA